jgi:glycerol uptake facilitator-like aquaporin
MTARGTSTARRRRKARFIENCSNASARALPTSPHSPQTGSVPGCCDSEAVAANLPILIPMSEVLEQMPTYSYGRRLTAEFVGTALLLATVVGSGIMGERLADGNVALALLVNTIATGAILVALILTFGPVSGAHFNPAVSAVEAMRQELNVRAAAAYSCAQVLGAVFGVFLAHAMFDLPSFAVSSRVRSGGSQILSESVATFGLLAVILGTARAHRSTVPFAVGAYITAAYWFTASTSFANPAVTLARSLTNTFAGIRPADVPGFLIGQFLGAGAAAALFAWLVREASVPHQGE